MKHFLLLFLLIAIVPCSLIAQSERTGLSAGLGYGATLGATTEQTDDIEFHGRVFFRYGLIENVHVELGGGIGRISGGTFSTLVVPIDARLHCIPVYMDSWHPFAYAGFGLFHYVGDILPNTNQMNRALNGWTSVIPLGAGVSFAITDRVSVEGSGGYNLTGTDNIDITETNSSKDNYWSLLLALTTTIEGGSADPDGDGLTNDQEDELGTDPKNPDTDADGLKDGEEVNSYQTDPKKGDSDNDKLSDFDEVKKYSTDPNKSDTDNDGLTDADEVLNSSTDPMKPDTDNDGLHDGDELQKYKTNPLKSDTDSDGLSDGDEVTKNKTNPLSADSDNGTVNDGVEVNRGTNPLDAADDVPKKETIQLEVGKNIVLEGITFTSGSAEITTESDQVLQKVINTFLENPILEVEIQGHTDNVGSRSSNVNLSNARAESVKMYLMNKGISETRITTKGFGPDKPIAPNTTDEGKQKNRRIEFVRVK